MNESISGMQDFLDDHTPSKEEVEMKLEKIDLLEKEINFIKNELKIANKRITKLQGRVEILEGGLKRGKNERLD